MGKKTGPRILEARLGSTPSIRTMGSLPNTRQRAVRMTNKTGVSNLGPIKFLIEFDTTFTN